VIRVLVVDDSAVVRRVLTQELSRHDGIEVVGSAMDPYVARDKILQLEPDVVTLDVEMPRLDGLTFLERLMEHHPLPVVIVSSLTPAHSELALRALSLGAVDVVPKPGGTFSIPDVAGHLVRAIRGAAGARASLLACRPSASPAMARDRALRTTHKVIAIGASTGGTTALEVLLRQFPPTTPGIVIVQHMPPFFTAAFAARLDTVCQMQVREARDGDVVVPGLALIAPGGQHLLLQRNGARYEASVRDGPPVHHQKPAVDVLFNAAATACGANAVGVILTGMGADGARGLLAMRRAGARTFAQDEKTCVVYGMPKEAVRMGAAEHVLPLLDIAQAVMDSLGA